VPAGDATVGSDGSDHDVSEALGPLVSNKTYHFRVVATSASGTTYGDDLSFAMAALAPAATTTAATAVTTTGATLNATINPENAATTYHFEYGPSSGTSLEQAPDIDADVGADELDHAVDEPITA
jgi:hypothetical protein